MPEKNLELSQNLNNLRVLVVGDIMLDQYWNGPVERISPEAPIPVIKFENEDIRLGGAANVARNIRRLGVNTKLIGLVGNDNTAATMLNLLEQEKIEHGLLKTQQPTITKLRLASQGHQIARIDFEEFYSESQAKDLLKLGFDSLVSTDLVCLSDYNKGTLIAPEWIKQCTLKRIPVIVDPKGDDFSKYRGATCLTPNQAEFEAVVGKVQAEDELLIKAGQLIKALELQYLLITRSDKGMILVDQSGKNLNLSAKAKTVTDVTGAGDTVVAVFSALFAAGMQVEFCAEAANSAAGVVVSKFGTTSVALADLERALVF